MKKACSILTIVWFVLLIFSVPIITKLQKHENFLFYENRNTNKILKLDAKNFKDGSFFESIEKYFVDVFPFRENILRFHTRLDREILRKSIVKDVVFGDNVLLADVKYSVKDDFEKVLQNSSNTADMLFSLQNVIEENGGKFYYIGLPEQYSYFRDRYPKHIFNNKVHLENVENIFFNELDKRNISFINMYDEFSQMGFPKELYSAVDHHYNFYGAFETYSCIMKTLKNDLELNIDILTKDDIDFIELPHNYIGSRNKKLMGCYMKDEKAVIGYPKEKVDFKRIDNGNVEVNDMFVIPVDKNQNLTYNVYMGGDIAETVITTDRPQLPNILIFGDSFTNPIESIIYTGFNETRSIDLRPYNKKSIKQYIEEFKPDIVLCIRDDTSYLNTKGNGDI